MSAGPTMVMVRRGSTAGGSELFATLGNQVVPSLASDSRVIHLVIVNNFGRLASCRAEAGKLRICSTNATRLAKQHTESQPGELPLTIPTVSP